MTGGGRRPCRTVAQRRCRRRNDVTDVVDVRRAVDVVEAPPVEQRQAAVGRDQVVLQLAHLFSQLLRRPFVHLLDENKWKIISHTFGAMFEQNGQQENVLRKFE